MSDAQFTENGIFYRHWPVAENIAGGTKAVVLLVHGLGEHCGRYLALASTLNQAGYAVGALDLPGHGRSEGARGHIGQFAEYQEAVLSLYAKIEQWHPDRPVFILGHSMGGLLTTGLLLEHQALFKGALLSGAALQSPLQPPAWQMFIMRVISTIAPKFGALALDAEGISRDSAVVENYVNDPLVHHGKVSARLLVELFKCMDESVAGAARIKLPIRIMHGREDVMAAAAGSELLHQRISSPDKELKIYDGLFHEIFNEPEGPAIFTEMVEWLNRH